MVQCKETVYRQLQLLLRVRPFFHYLHTSMEINHPMADVSFRVLRRSRVMVARGPWPVFGMPALMLLYVAGPAAVPS